MSAPPSSGECPQAAEAVAYVQGELAPDEAAAFERHLEACSGCREEVAGTREALVRLRELPDGPERDLAPGILGRIPAGAWAADGGRRRRLLLRRASLVPAAAAALLAAVLGVSALVTRSPGRGGGDSPPRREEAARLSGAVSRALEWLASSQEPDGSWAAERWGGNANYTVGLTGLALLSFLAEGGPLDGPGAEAAGRAAGYIVSRQAPDGRLGPSFSGKLYNHGIATVALVELYALGKEARLELPVARAVGYIRSRQSPEGGWGYSGGRQVNTAITVWQLNALLLAASLEWPDARPAADRGLAWLEGMIDSRGRAGYDGRGRFPYGPEGLTAMAAFSLAGGKGAGRARALAGALRGEEGKLDYYRSFFLAYALRAVEETRAPGAGETPVDEMLVETQVKEGPNRGSFEPLDRWSNTGGRVYATAAAALSLQADEHAPRLIAMMQGTAR
jgi:hypothetical protein